MKYTLLCLCLCLCLCGCPSRYRATQPDPEQGPVQPYPEQVFLDKVKASLKELVDETDILYDEGMALHAEYEDLATQKIKILNTFSDEELDAFAAFEKVSASTSETEVVKVIRNVKRIIPAEKRAPLAPIFLRQNAIATRIQEIGRRIKVIGDRDKQIREVLKDSLAHSRQTELAEINAGDMFLPPIQHDVFIYHPYP